MKVNYDQYYTKSEIAKSCYIEFDKIVSKYIDYNILEPSAGNGSFLNVFDKPYYACDIDPKHTNIEVKNFLKDDISQNILPNSVIIGNPPFGNRGKLAIKFINKGFEYVKTIGFILPLQFQKYSAQKDIIEKAKLIYDKILPENGFLCNGKDFNVRCCFQIWTTEETNYPNLRLLDKPITTHSDFDMWQYNNTREAEKYFNKSVYSWDFAVPRQGYKDYNIKETDPNKMDRKTQWIFFKAKDNSVLEKLYKLDFSKLSLKNTSTPGFGKADVIKEYDNLFKKSIDK